MFKKPFSFEGRIRRTEYGLSLLIYYGVVFVISMLAEAGNALSILALVALFPLIWFMLAQGCKRCHDRGNPGWYQLIPFYPLWMLFAEGEGGENGYGPDPKDSNATEQPTAEG